MNGTASAGSEPSTWYVDVTGSGNYTTIQDAVNNSTTGGTIIVYPGMYNESVDINVENLSILSYSGNPENTIVRHIGSGHNFKISADNVTISGFNITGTNSTGIYVNGVSGANITNNKISGIGCSVQIQSSSNCTLINNTANDSAQYGFYLQSSSNCTLANNTVSNTTSFGIYLLHSGHCTLNNNIVSDTGSYGIILDGSSYGTMFNNKLTNTYDRGICLYSSSNCNFTGNTCSNTDYGFYLYDSSGCNLTGNTIYESSFGILLYQSIGYNLTNNTFSNIDSDAIILSSSNGCILTSNTISNSGCGLYLYYSSNCNLTSNNISNSENGIYLYNSSSCNLTINDISDVYEDGIYLYNSSSCNLSGNTISESPYGLYISTSGNCTLTNNTVSSGMFGLCLFDIENCTATDNIMSGNWYNFELEYDDEDIDLNNTTGNIIDTSNLVDGKPIYYFEREANPSIGSDAGVIYCINCGNTEIKDCVLQNNTYAILLYNTSSNIQNNTINNTVYGVGVVSSHDIRVSDSRFKNSLAAVMAQETMNVTIAKNSIQNFIYGIATIASENCTLTDNNILNSTTPYSLYSSANSDMVNGEKSALIKENSFTGSNLVQYVRSYGVGIYSVDSQKLIIEDNILNQSYRGICLEGCQNSNLARNSIRNIVDTGIYSEDSSDVDLLDNTVQNVTGETQNYEAGNSSLVGSREAYGYGIYFDYSQNISLVRNSVSDIGCIGICSEDSSNVELLENTIQNVIGSYALPRAGNSSLVSSSLVGERRVLGYGIYLYDLEDITLKGNNVKNCYSVWAIYLIEPINATVESNTLQNCEGGLLSIQSENFSVSDCSATNCTSGGILIVNTEENEGTGYMVSGCSVEGSYLGLAVVGHGTFTGNTLSGNSYGLVLYDVNNSLIYGNTMEQNSLAGLAFDIDREELMSHIGLVGSIESPESGNNTIYNNYFNNINNTLFYSDTNNTWNTSKTAGENIIEGPYLGGNYWANPNGTGFSENCTDANRDGIADSSYEIKNGTYDYLPLTITPSTSTHRSSANYVPSSESSGVTGIDSAQKRVTAGTKTTFSFNNPVSGILGLSFMPQLYSGNVVVRIEVLDNVSVEKPLGEIYRLMNILVGNERFESGSNINGASLNFRVSKSWVEENNIDVSTITINRFQKDKWNPLVTEITHEDEEYYYFTAETPGFSKYAITGEKLETEIITPAEQKENETITGEEQTTDVKKSIPGFESAFSVLGVVVSVFFARKRTLK